MTTVSSSAVDGIRLLRLFSDGANTLDAEVVATIRTVLRDAEVAAAPVLLCGGPRFFCNGLDLGWALERTHAELFDFFLGLGALVLDLLELQVPVGAAMAGHAVGAGKTLVLASDVRVGATGRCLFGAPEVLLGVPNPVFSDRLLRSVTSDQTANRLLYSGTLITAEEAASLSLLDETVEAGAVERRATELVQAHAAMPRGAWAASKRQRSLDLCASIRAQLAQHTEQVLLAHWFGGETQRRLHEAAARLTR